MMSLIDILLIMTIQIGEYHDNIQAVRHSVWHHDLDQLVTQEVLTSELNTDLIIYFT